MVKSGGDDVVRPGSVVVKSRLNNVVGGLVRGTKVGTENSIS